jgi:hypothetical protein
MRRSAGSIAIVAASALVSGLVPLLLHQAQAAYGPMWMRLGHLGADGSVAWGTARKFDDGVSPAVALYGSTVLAVHQGQEGNGSLWLKMGALGSDGSIAWRTTKQYDDGGHPALAVDPLSGRGEEIHVRFARGHVAQPRRPACIIWRRVSIGRAPVIAASL